MSLWKSDIDIRPVAGGITNQNFVVIDQNEKYFVRLGNDIPEHGIMRFNELAASKAAHQAEISPAVIHAEPGIMVLQYIDGVALTAEDVRKPELLAEIISLMKHCHYEVPKFLHGPCLVFWVFQVLRDYSNTLQKTSNQYRNSLSDLLKIAEQLEEDVGEIQLSFAHNDLLAANFIHDGNRLWLIDWEYAGFNSPLFDLAGLASNSNFSAEQEMSLLNSYFGHTPEQNIMKKYSAMKAASLLRETLWSMVSETHSKIDFDYRKYSQENLEKFNSSWDLHQTQWR